MKDKFCILPWVHTMVSPNGNVTPCCISTHNDKDDTGDYPNILGSLHKNTMKEIWNSEKMKKLRVNFLNNKIDENICKACINAESLGNISYRQNMNKTHLHKNLDIVESTKEDGHVDEYRIRRLDFRFSNICNMACIYCMPDYSSKWIRDARKYDLPQIPFIDDDIIYKEILPDVMNQLEDIDEFYFAGGEPLLIKQHWEILDKLIENNLAHTKTIQYNTNGTTLVYKNRNVVDLWNKFKKVDLMVSIDATEDVFEMIRYGGKWEKIVENLLYIQEFATTVNLIFFPTISAYNIKHIDKLLEFFLKHHCFRSMENYDNIQWKDFFNYIFDINVLYGPKRFSMTNMKYESKLEAVAALNRGKQILKQYTKENFHDINFSKYNQLYEHLRKETSEYEYERGKNELIRLSKLRNQDLLTLL